MELDFDKYCVVDGSPTTVLPSPWHCPEAKKRRSKRKPKCGNETLCSADNNFHQYRSVSCKVSRSLTSNSEGTEVLRRGSVNRTSKELRCFLKTNSGEERRKIELPSGSVKDSSLGIIDALCSSEEDSSQVEEIRFSVMSMNSELSAETCKNLHAERAAPPNDMSRSAKVVGDPTHEGNRPRETDHHTVFPKSSSAKYRELHSPAQSGSDCSRASSSYSRFTPMKKILDPFRKSKSQRSPVVSGLDLEFKGSQKPMPHRFSNLTRHLDSCSPPAQKESCNSPVPFLPTHLHGFLRLDRKQGVPSFEFSVNFPEDVLLAKTWRVGNTLNWLYTFHSLCYRRKSHGSGFGSNDGTKEPLLVGQMQVSSFLCTEVKNAGESNNSLVMEFVLYDTSHPKKCFSSWDSSSPSSDDVQGKTKTENQQRNVAAKLHQQLEIAGIVIEVPIQKRECESEENLSNLMMGLIMNEQNHCDASPSKVAVVIPSGNHSLPTTESRCCPSPLLDRWRSGGGCDCGGWDMSCPLNVLYTPNSQNSAHCPLIDKHRPLQLFIQGRKDKTPALTIRMMEDGQYGVVFHAQLSALQAFSICVAVLHAMEAPVSIVNNEERKSLVQDSVRLFVENEVRNPIKAFGGEEEKQKGNNTFDKLQPCFALNPPFSPIARV